jgi:hypothetical protein
MKSSSVVSLLVAALAMLGRPCPRNTAVARLLLQRASLHDDLSAVERDTCLNLAESLDAEADTKGQARDVAVPPRPITDWGATQRQQLLRETRQWMAHRVSA